MFECLCQEKEGAIWRSVYVPLVTIPWAMDKLDKLQRVENFLPDGSEMMFLLDHRNSFIQIDDVGLIAVIPKEDMPDYRHVHITFWDGRLRGRERMCRAIATFVQGLMKVKIVTMVPAYRHTLRAFATRAGFEDVGSVDEARVLLFTNYRG